MKGKCPCGFSQVIVKARNWAWDSDVGGQWFAVASCRRCGRHAEQGKKPFRTERLAATDAVTRLKNAKPLKDVL